MQQNLFFESLRLIATTKMIILKIQPESYPLKVSNNMTIQSKTKKTVVLEMFMLINTIKKKTVAPMF